MSCVAARKTRARSSPLSTPTVCATGCGWGGQCGRHSESFPYIEELQNCTSPRQTPWGSSLVCIRISFLCTSPASSPRWERSVCTDLLLVCTFIRVPYTSPLHLCTSPSRGLEGASRECTCLPLLCTSGRQVRE